MGHQHQELRRWLEDAKKLRLYAKAAASEHCALKESLGKAQSQSRFRERTAKEGSKKRKVAEKERDKAKEEAHIARLAAIAAGDSKEKIEGDLVRVKDALAAAEEAKTLIEEARRKAKSKATRLEVDQTSLLLELGTVKDEVSSLQS